MNELAQALVNARRNHVTLDSSEWAAALSDADEAYAVLDAVADMCGWFTAAPKTFWKSGGASRAATLTHAALPPSGVQSSPASLEGWRFHAPQIEAEVALRLACDVEPQQAQQLRHEDVDAMIDAITVSIEIVDSRWREGMRAPELLRLADLQSHGALVLGAWQAYRRRDWSTQRCEVRIGARTPVLRTGSHPLQDPAWLLPAWLRHATRQGQAVPAGTVVTTGTWVGVLPAQKGDLVEVSFENLGSASVRL